MFQGHEAEGIREQIAALKIEAANGKITKVAYHQQLLALLFALEKTQTKLTSEEVTLREQCKAQGAQQLAGTNAIG